MAQKQVTVFKARQFDSEWMPESLQLAALWLMRKLESIPVQHRAQATIEIDAHPKYDMEEASITISYTREQSAEEIQQDEERAKQGRDEQIRYLEKAIAQLREQGSG